MGDGRITPIMNLHESTGTVLNGFHPAVSAWFRSSFNYPLLIGAKALREFGAAVNPARRYTADKPDC